MRRRAWLAGILFLVLAAGCGEPPPPTALQVGSHRISVVMPRGWEHLNYGGEHQLRRGFDRISLADMGQIGGGIDVAVDVALGDLREDGRREEASRNYRLVDGRKSVTVDTWDRVSHEYRERYLIVLDSRSLLVVHTMQGQFETMAEAFDGLAASLAFADTLAGNGAVGER